MSPYTGCTGATITYTQVSTVSTSGSIDEITAFDTSTGIFTIENPYFTGPRVYTLSVSAIPNSGGSSQSSTTISDIVLTFACGPASTTITAPTLTEVVSAVETFTLSASTTSTLDRTYEFTNSNNVCPITSIAESIDDQNVFTITYTSGGSYTVSLSATAARTVGLYTYTVIATAEGGATATVS